MTLPTPLAVVLAAGKGTRLRSTRPKVLHEVGGRPLLGWVLDAARAAGCARLLVVVGHGAAEIRAAFPEPDLVWVEQPEQRGTGHALAVVAPALRGESTLLVLSGDVPLVQPATLARLLAAVEGGAWGALAVATVESPGRLGRVLARPGGGLERIVEASDASAAELATKRVNAGLYALPAPAIFGYLEGLAPANAQGELYLTDALGAAVRDGRELALVELAEEREAWGVNDRAELARVHRELLAEKARQLMEAGVTLLDPDSTAIEPGVEVEPDTVLEADVTLLGRTAVGPGCTLRRGAWLRDTRLGAGVVLEPYCVLEGTTIGEGSRVGPFVHLPPASVLPPRTRLSGPGTAAGSTATDGVEPRPLDPALRRGGAARRG